MTFCAICFWLGKTSFKTSSTKIWETAPIGLTVYSITSLRKNGNTVSLDRSNLILLLHDWFNLSFFFCCHLFERVSRCPPWKGWALHFGHLMITHNTFFPFIFNITCIIFSNYYNLQSVYFELYKCLMYCKYWIELKFTPSVETVR